MKILEVKERYQAVSGMAVDDQRLIFRGIQLRNEQSVGECNIEEGAEIHVAMTLRGC